MRVSVVIPAYNCECYIAEALESVLIQGSSVFEVLVVDDGSIDGTRGVVKAFGSPVRLISQENRGPAAARNNGLKQALGDYIAFLDGDDVWLPGKLDAQLAYLAANPTLRFVFGRISYWFPDVTGGYAVAPPEESSSAPMAIDSPASGWIYPELLLDSVVCIITALMHRSVYEAVGGFDESLRTGEDYDYWLKLSRQFEMHKLSRYLARYRLHGQGATRIPRPESNEVRVLSRAIECFGMSGPDGRSVDQCAYKERMAALWFDHGYLHYWHGDARVATKAFSNALKFRWRAKTHAYRGLAAIRSLMSSRNASKKIGDAT